MKWLEVTVKTKHEAVEIIADFFTELGAAGVQVNDPGEFLLLQKLTPGSGEEKFSFAADDEPDVDMQVYFPVAAGDGVVVSLEAEERKTAVGYDVLKSVIRHRLDDLARFMAIGRGEINVREIHEEDWSENWKKYYQTLHLTERLVINPSWIDYTGKSGEVVISLDPGSAFGTGTHESTILCARFLDKLVKPGEKVLDLGTGSGILAVIAARLGAEVEAVDIDPLAVSVAKGNVRKNKVEILLHTGELKDVKGCKFDLIAVNIIADVIISLLPGLVQKMEIAGHLVASGIIRQRVDEVIAAAVNAGLTVVAREQENEWVALVFRHQIAAAR